MKTLTNRNVNNKERAKKYYQFTHLPHETVSHFDFDHVTSLWPLEIHPPPPISPPFGFYTPNTRQYIVSFKAKGSNCVYK